MDYFDIVFQAAGVLVAIIVLGVGVVPFTNFVKGIFGLEGAAAKWLSVALSVILGVASAIAAGEITGDMISFENLAALVTLVWVISQDFYDKHYSS